MINYFHANVNSAPGGCHEAARECEANKTRSAVSGSEVGREVAVGDACVIC